MNVKNTMAATMIIVGLIISIIGWNKKASDTITQDVKGEEVVLRNSDSQHSNWRGFIGILVIVVGVGVSILPGDKQLEAERYGR